jgi:hypothetical protein
MNKHLKLGVIILIAASTMALLLTAQSTYGIKELKLYNETSTLLVSYGAMEVALKREYITLIKD